MKELTCCPYCGYDGGLFSKEVVRFPQYYKYDGEPDGYGEFDRIQRKKTTPLYCIGCEKRITTLEDLTDGQN